MGTAFFTAACHRQQHDGARYGCFPPRGLGGRPPVQVQIPVLGGSIGGVRGGPRGRGVWHPWPGGVFGGPRGGPWGAPARFLVRWVWPGLVSLWSERNKMATDSLYICEHGNETRTIMGVNIGITTTQSNATKKNIYAIICVFLTLTGLQGISEW